MRRFGLIAILAWAFASVAQAETATGSPPEPAKLFEGKTLMGQSDALNDPETFVDARVQRGPNEAGKTFRADTFARVPTPDTEAFITLVIREVSKGLTVYGVDLLIFYLDQDWRSYDKAVSPDGEPILTRSVEKRALGCARGPSQCLFAEVFRVVPGEELFLPGVDFQVSGQRGEPFVVRIDEVVTQSLRLQAQKMFDANG